MKNEIDFDHEFEIAKSVLEAAHATPRSKAKINYKPPYTHLRRVIVGNALIAIKVDYLHLREVLLLLATHTEKDTKSKCLLVYKKIKELQEELENTLGISHNEDFDNFHDSIGEQMQRRKDLHEICARLEGHELDRLIKLGKKILRDKIT